MYLLHKNPTSLLINLSLSHRTIHHLFQPIYYRFKYQFHKCKCSRERGRKEERKRKKEEENSR